MFRQFSGNFRKNRNKFPEEISGLTTLAVILLGAVPGEVDLVTGSNDGTTSCPQVVNKTSLSHVFSNNVVYITENDADESDEVCMPQCPITQRT